MNSTDSVLNFLKVGSLKDEPVKIFINNSIIYEVDESGSIPHPRFGIDLGFSYNAIETDYMTACIFFIHVSLVRSTSATCI